ncbi:endolytic transglycosylase MltG [Candidatus Methylocalor cossyra]|uniref:Endolytic murein transglycosylase n=1 Tax=Candidatus Methylocalor cossyra TaxID=3108543 RepID=A0ABP1C6C6_9GAMM
MGGKEDSGRIGGTVWRLIGAVALVAAVVIGGLWVDYRETLDRPLGIKETAYFEIAKGEGLSHIADRLKAQGIVTKPLWFKVLAYREGVHTRLRYGEYAIPPNTTLRGLLAMFVAGKVRQHPVALVEGWTFQDLLAALGRHPALVGTTVGKSPEEIMALLGAPGQSPEGRFFPDTYFVTKGTTDLELLRRAHERMRAVLEREWQERAPSVPFASADQALILASIVEKETARPEERPAVAGVLVRRLAKGMRLQTDPTVIYGLGADFGGNLRKSDLKRDTPYNTYTRPGLPPTPIALPGLASIRAALHPAEGASLYFVARGDGSHVFSATLDEHRRAVDLFQKH